MYFLIHVCMRVCRLRSIQYDLGQQIKVDFEKAFSVKGAPVSRYLCGWHTHMYSTLHFLH